jgi:hypothetical protein
MAVRGGVARPRRQLGHSADREPDAATRPPGWYGLRPTPNGHCRIKSRVLPGDFRQRVGWPRKVAT